MSEKTFIIIKGSDWLYKRLDAIGITDRAEQKSIMKRIWCKDRSLSKDFLHLIIGDKKK